MMARVLTFFILLFVPPLYASSVNECKQLFLYPDGTGSLIAYVNSVSDEIQLTDREYLQFVQALERGEVSNLISQRRARLDSKLKIHRQGIERVLNDSAFDIPYLLTWVKNKLSVQALVRHERSQVAKEVLIPARKPEFVRIVDINPSHDERISPYPVELMKTHVTQKMWVDVMKENPSHWIQGPNQFEIYYGARKSTIQPNNPVESITFWSAIVFANMFSRKYGLPPAYNLDFIRFDNVKDGAELFQIAATGELQVSDSYSYKVFAERNSVAELVKRPGFRLPTSMEYNRLVFQMARALGISVNGINPKSLSSLAWTRANTPEGEGTQPVGTTDRSVRIENQSVHDLLGNARIWLHVFEREGISDDRHAFKSGADGGDCEFNVFSVIPGAFFISLHPDAYSRSVGLRLIRSVVP